MANRQGHDLYEIKFKKYKGGKIHKWHRFAPDAITARASTAKFLKIEFSDKVQIVSVRKLSLAEEKRFYFHG